MKKFVISQGTITGFIDEVQIPGVELSDMESNRVSKIYPANPFLRFLFKVIRNSVENNSPIANWTRKWSVLWSVSTLEKELIGKFKNREEAISYEKKLYWSNRV